MSSQNINNPGQYHSDGTLWVGSSLNITGGHNYFGTSKRDPSTDSFKLGLHFGEAPVIDSNLFVGRSFEIQTIQDALQPQKLPQEQRRLVLGGLGGVGKTQLVIAYVRQHRNSYDTILWLNATSKLSLDNGLRLVAGQFVDPHELDKLSADQVTTRVRTWLSNPRNSRWLLIFDNYDEPDQYDLGKHYPTAAHGSIIVTTRVLDQMPFIAQQIRLQPLQSIDESLEILAKRSERQNVKEDSCARQLAQRFAGLPLALASAGAYLRQVGSMSFQAYLEAYEHSWNIDRTRPLQLQEYRDHTLYTTWNISYARFSQEDPDAAQLLKLFAYFDNRQIWYELVSAANVTPAHSKSLASSFRQLFSRAKTIPKSDESPMRLQRLLHDRARFEAAMIRLVQYCFIEVETTTKLYSLHGCVHDWITEELNKTAGVHLFWYAVRCVSKNIEEKKKQVNDLRTLLFASHVPHAARIGHYASTRCRLGGDIPVGHVSKLREIACLLYHQSHFREAEELYLWILDKLPMKVDILDEISVTVVGDLSSLYMARKKYTDAENVIVRALEGRSEPESELMLRVKYSLGALKAEQGELAEGEAILLEVLKGQERAFGVSHSEIFRTVNRLGMIYEQQGRFEQAEKMLLRALAGWEEQPGRRRKRVLQTSIYLADVYHRQGRYKDAEAIYIPVISELAEKLGPQHAGTLGVVGKLVAVYYVQGKEIEAAEVERQFRSI